MIDLLIDIAFAAIILTVFFWTVVFAIWGFLWMVPRHSHWLSRKVDQFMYWLQVIWRP